MALFGNTEIDAKLNDYALHSYWANLEQKKAFADYFFARYPSKKLHMTEWCEMKGGRDYGMDSALVLAGEIVDDVVTGGVSSWQYWIAVSRYNFRDGLIYVNEADRSIMPTKRLWAMGNFSRFIRPGFRRFDVENSSPDLKVLGATDPSSGATVLVVVNPTSQSVNVQLQLPGDGRLGQYTVYETSETRDLEELPAGVPAISYYRGN